MKCEQFRAALWDSLDDGNPLTQDAREHAQDCPACAGYQAQASRMEDLLPHAWTGEAAPSAVRAVLSKIREEETRQGFSMGWLPAGAFACAAFWYGLWTSLGTETLLYWLPPVELPDLTGWISLLTPGEPPPPLGQLAGLTILAGCLWISTHKTLLQGAAGRNHD